MIEQELIRLADQFDIALIAERISRPVPANISAQEISAWGRPPRSNPQLVQLLRGFDIVHCHDSLGMMLAALAAAKRYVVTSHGIGPILLRPSIRSAAEGIATLVAYRFLYRSAEAVVAISKYIAAWLQSFAGVHPWLIRNGAPDVRQLNPAAVNRRRLLYVGEVSRRKGIGDLIAGLAHSPTDVSLDIVGAGNDRRFHALAARHGVVDRVRFLGYLEPSALEEAYSSAFCTCSASHWEGFGLPVLEGFSFGRPTIVRAQGGLRELVDESQAGTTFRKAADMPSCIDLVTQNWDSLAHCALEYARRHPWSDTFAAYRDLFESLFD